MTDTAEKRMWQAVDTHALIEAAKSRDKAYLGTPDFHVVCTYAGLEAEAVASRIAFADLRKLMRAA